MDELFIGLMSGTSLDGVDAVLLAFPVTHGLDGPRPTGRDRPRMVAHTALPFPDSLRAACLALNTSGNDELHRAALVGNAVTRLYAAAVKQLLADPAVSELAHAAHAAYGPVRVRAIGAHGQTVRHRPGAFDGTGYTLQLQNPALLAELTGIDVVADFRSRDVAAGGQGAPLVPAFHADWFGQADADVAVLNIGGIANLSLLPALGAADEENRGGGLILGFDCGPGNALIDLWCQRHTGERYDRHGAWAAKGMVQDALLSRMLDEPYFLLEPPKSTGRDLFHAAWLNGQLAQFPHQRPVDVQATLIALTVEAAARSLLQCTGGAPTELIVCGGGAFNATLMRGLRNALPGHKVSSSADHGLAADQVEAAAFAWLAHRTIHRLAGNLPSVTGAKGPRILGAIYPA